MHMHLPTIWMISKGSHQPTGWNYPNRPLMSEYTGKWTSEVPRVKGRYIFYGKLFDDDMAHKEGESLQHTRII